MYSHWELSTYCMHSHVRLEVVTVMYAHSSNTSAHIPQPPHSAGLKFQGLRANIDPSQIPSPIDAIELDKEQWRGQAYMTLPGKHVPLSTTDFVAIDQGNSSPKFARVSTWSIPNSPHLAAECEIPLAAVFQPFAELDPDEEQVPLVLDLSSTSAPNLDVENRSGPARCGKCRGYVNPWCMWIAGGNRWRCNLCHHENEVPPHYFSSLDPLTHLRLDHLQRPELNKGTVDFDVSSVDCADYWASPPLPTLSTPSYFSVGPAAPSPSAPTTGPSSSAAATGLGSALGLGLSSALGTSSTASSSLAGRRPPKPMNIIFAFDVSGETAKLGFLRAACKAVKGVLFGSRTGNDNITNSTDVTSTETTAPTEDDKQAAEDVDMDVGPCFPRASQVAILTYDTTLHFYDISPHLTQASMLVLPDTEEVFVPFPVGEREEGSRIFVEPEKSRTVIEHLLDALPRRFEPTVSVGAVNRRDESNLSAAVRAGLAALAGRGGQLIIFQSTPPSAFPAPSTLSSTFPSLSPSSPIPASPTVMEETSLYGTDDEKKLFLPRDKAWQALAEECAEEGVGINVFLGNVRFVDVGSIAALCSTTGGEIFFHPRFDPAYDSVVLNSQLHRLLTRTTVYNCMMRIRCSQGLRVSAHYGNFHQRSPTDLEFGTFDADKAISISLEHSSRSLDPDPGDYGQSYAFLQCAMLYTTVGGQRRVRTINLALQIAALAGSVFRFADMDVAVCHFIREAIFYRTSQRLAQIREDLTEKCSALLLGYRRQCAASTAPSQLIIPEAFRALPVYILAITKSKPLKGRNVSADVRNYSAHKLMSSGVRSTVQYLYPPLLALHDLDDDIALADPTTGRINLPSLMRDSHIYMEAHGLYLIDNGEQIIFWIGSSVSPQLLADLFGVDDSASLDPHLTHFPVLQTRFSTQVRNILAHRYAQRGHTPKMLISRQNVDGFEIEFSDMLVEDQNNAALSYVDYLCLVHKQISTALTNGSFSPGIGFRGSPW